MKRFPSTTTLTLVAALASPLGAQTHKTPSPTDWQIESQVQQALTSEHAFKGSSIQSGVSKGIVTLSGNVRSEAEKALASSELADIKGVRTVLNNLAIVDNSTHTPTTAPASKAVLPTGPKTITLPSGTAIPIRLSDEINTKTARANDTFHGTTAAAVTTSGFTAIPAGTSITGRLSEAKAAGHFSGSAELAVELVSLRLPAPSGPEDVSILTQELSNKAVGRGANTAEKAGGGAAFGAIIGALAGGGAGAGIGAASGGGLGLGANALTRGKEIDLKPEQLLTFRTSAPLDIKIVLVEGQQAVPQATVPSLQGRTADNATQRQ